jgi:hypothetical protein
MQILNVKLHDSSSTILPSPQLAQSPCSDASVFYTTQIRTVAMLVQLKDDMSKIA